MGQTQRAARLGFRGVRVHDWDAIARERGAHSQLPALQEAAAMGAGGSSQRALCCPTTTSRRKKNGENKGLTGGARVTVTEVKVVGGKRAAG
jgi:hypothetical protein